MKRYFSSTISYTLTGALLLALFVIGISSTRAQQTQPIPTKKSNNVRTFCPDGQKPCGDGGCIGADENCTVNERVLPPGKPKPTPKPRSK